VKPKGQYTYHWDVPERAGPGPADPSSVVWLYHAHDHEGVDIYAGLVGAIIVTRSASANPDGTPKDVDREFVTLFMIFDENMSPYLDANIQRFAGSPNAVRKKDGEFKESNKKHTINGLLFGNLNGLTMRRGEFDRPWQRKRYPHRSLARQYGAAPRVTNRHGQGLRAVHGDRLGTALRGLQPAL
jgi:hypothetical protein